MKDLEANSSSEDELAKDNDENNQLVKKKLKKLVLSMLAKVKAGSSKLYVSKRREQCFKILLERFANKKFRAQII